MRPFKTYVLTCFLMLLSMGVLVAAPVKGNNMTDPDAGKKPQSPEGPAVLFNEREWKLPRPDCVVDDGKGLILRKDIGAERVTSKTKYQYGVLEVDARFNSFKNDNYYYIGFMSRDPWAKNVVWLTNDGTRKFFIKTAKDGQLNNAPPATPDLEENRWYTFRIEWKPGATDRLERRPDTVDFYLDGKLVSSLGTLESMPLDAVPVVFDAASQKKSETQMEIRNLKITPGDVVSKEATLSKVIPIPPAPKVLAKEIDQTEPSVEINGGDAYLENGFLRCHIDMKSGHITSLFNKYTESEMLHKESRLFVINAQGTDVQGDKYRLIRSKKIKGTDNEGIEIVWQNKVNQFLVKLELLIDRNSPYISMSLNATNTGKELLTLGITAPLIEHIRIGDKVEDDYHFFPMMTGWSGKLPVRIRQTYGHLAWMQLLSVFDPVVGGGVFTYTRDKEGVPKNLIVNKRNLPNEDPVKNSTSAYSDEDPGDIFSKLPGTAMAIRHFRYELKADKSCQIPVAVIGVSHGDWHDSFNSYKKWVSSWFNKSYEMPQWFRDNYNYISRHPPVFMNESENRYVYAEKMGPNEIDAMSEWAFWWDYSEEFAKTISSEHTVTKHNDGDYDYNVARGGLPALRDEIGRIHENGGRIQLYTLPVGLWEGSRIGKAHGAQWGRKSSNGNYTHEWVMPGRGYNACLYVSGWQDFFSERMATVIEESGADSYRLDVAAALFPCYNEDHDHYDGTPRSSTSASKMGEFLQKCSDLARKANPDATVMAEHAGSEYMSQYIDGYLTQQFRENVPFFAQFRGMNAYNLVFMRFLLPEVKVIVFGFEEEDGGKRAFFNAVGQDRGAASSSAIRYMTRTHRVLIENGDAVNTLHPEPLIPTLQEGLMANAFPGESKRLWTLYNPNDDAIEGDLLEVETQQLVHYVEALEDTPLKFRHSGDKTIISGSVEPKEVISIVELPKRLNAGVIGNELKVKISDYEGDMRLEYYVGPDDLHKKFDADIKSGIARATIENHGKVIVKLYQGKYLLDQAIVLR